MVQGVQILSDVAQDAQKVILTTGALEFLAALHRTFENTRQKLLSARKQVQHRIDAGLPLDFLEDTADVREDRSWHCVPCAPGLEDRRVEVIGPTDKATIVNGMNSGAKVFLADLEDANAPTFANMLNGQLNLYDAIRGTLTYEEDGTFHQLDRKTAVLIIRLRGWHLDEPRITIDQMPISAAIFDFALYFYHNAHELVKQGRGPYFYPTKMEHYLEARLWNDIFLFSQSYIGLPCHTIRATALIETLPAVFQMEEILFELRNHSAGLNCGRWDYIFSYIKMRRTDRGALLPDRKDVTMAVPFMDAYVRLLIQTCHKRNAAAMGGLSAQVPIKDDVEAHTAAMEKVRTDKLREVRAGHDGTWIAHPLIKDVAMGVFNDYMHGPNQYHIRREDVRVAAADLLNSAVPGSITEKGVKENVSVCVAYTAAFLGGNGVIIYDHLLEDVATAEITRAQLWQWVRHGARQKDGRLITAEYVDRVTDEVVRGVKNLVPGLEDKNIIMAANYLKNQVRRDMLSDFMTSDFMPYFVNEECQQPVQIQTASKL